MQQMIRAIGIGAVVLIIAAGCTAPDWFRDDGFEAERWRAADQGCAPDNPRLGMFDELEDALLRERPTRSEVLELLGPPDAGEEPDSIRYQLGYNMIDCDFVLIQFGPDDRVAEVRYVQG